MTVMAQWRIVTDRYSGYEVQKRSCLWPFWHQPRTNTHHTVAEAEEWARREAKGRNFVVKELGDLNDD